MNQNYIDIVKKSLTPNQPQFKEHFEMVQEDEQLKTTEILIEADEYKDMLHRDTNHQRVLGFLSGIATGLQYCEDPKKATESINNFLEKLGEK